MLHDFGSSSRVPNLRWAVLWHSPLNLSIAPEYKRLGRSWVLVSWIWSLLWHMPLDLIKWAMAYVLNEDGFRQRIHGKKPTNIATETAEVDLPSQARSLPCLCMYIYTLSAIWVGLLMTKGCAAAKSAQCSLL